MKTLRLTVLVGMLAGCATAPSGHWEQEERTELETQDDYAHCEKVAYLDSQRNKTDGHSKELRLRGLPSMCGLHIQQESEVSLVFEPEVG